MDSRFPTNTNADEQSRLTRTLSEWLAMVALSVMVVFGILLGQALVDYHFFQLGEFTEVHIMWWVVFAVAALVALGCNRVYKSAR